MRVCDVRVSETRCRARCIYQPAMPCDTPNGHRHNALPPNRSRHLLLRTHGYRIYMRHCIARWPNHHHHHRCSGPSKNILCITKTTLFAAKTQFMLHSTLTGGQTAKTVLICGARIAFERNNISLCHRILGEFGLHLHTTRCCWPLTPQDHQQHSSSSLSLLIFVLSVIVVIVIAITPYNNNNTAGASALPSSMRLVSLVGCQQRALCQPSTCTRQSSPPCFLRRSFDLVDGRAAHGDRTRTCTRAWDDEHNFASL